MPGGVARKWYDCRSLRDGALIDILCDCDPEVLKAPRQHLMELPVSIVHAGHFRSVGRQRMIAPIGEHDAGGLGVGDAAVRVARPMRNAAGHAGG